MYVHYGKLIDVADQDDGSLLQNRFVAVWGQID